MFLSLWRDECGAIYSTELLLVTSVVIAGLASGLTSFRDAVNSEFTDIAAAVQELNQSYLYGGIRSPRARTAGSDFVDRYDGGGQAMVCVQVYE
jgi:Flp pilus assembly pilin Flp